MGQHMSIEIVYRVGSKLLSFIVSVGEGMSEAELTRTAYTEADRMIPVNGKLVKWKLG